ncbi:MAG: glycosyltransferase [Candidatus Zophobacter franzmannii]|nr:glycosyltransferase [Candidatus Zophobacter franzmannii]
MIINEFPPTGESGVQRSLKFVKYLSRAGHEVHVITPRKPVKNILDYSLCDEIPRSVKIHYTANWGIKGKTTQNIAKTKNHVSDTTSIFKKFAWESLKFVNDVLFPFDKQMGWIPFAFSKACHLIKKHNIRNIYITSYPFSAQIIGLKLKKRYGEKIFYVADYRDSWQFEPKLSKNVSQKRLSRIVSVDNKVLKTCDHLTAATEKIRMDYVNLHPSLKGNSTTIYNGYDDDDFQNLPKHTNDKFCYLLMGKIYDFKGSPEHLLEAMSKLKSDFQFIHIGTIPPKMLSKFNEKYSFFHHLGYKSHREALSLAASADVLVIILNNDIHSASVVPGKLFECIRLNKPILSLCPTDGLLAEIINDNGLGTCSVPDNVEEIVVALNQINSQRINSNINEFYQFSREHQAKRLEEIFKSNETTS